MAEEGRRRIGRCGPAGRTLRRQAELPAQVDLAVPTAASIDGPLIDGSLDECKVHPVESASLLRALDSRHCCVP